jgi:hypothetical protein
VNFVVVAVVGAWSEVVVAEVVVGWGFDVDAVVAGAEALVEYKAESEH